MLVNCLRNEADITTNTVYQKRKTMLLTDLSVHERYVKLYLLSSCSAYGDTKFSKLIRVATAYVWNNLNLLFK